MAASVQVLCPNGRRQNVKITPNTKLLQVLEEVCKRQGFIPPEDYILMHGRNQVDLSLSIRFAGISNNAKLELVKSTVSRQEEDVMIALQLVNGNRVQDKFSPSATLWDILLHFEDKHSECKGQLLQPSASQGEALQPVCIFMQEQIVGESALVATSLKKLGLTSGKAIIRLLHRPVEDAVMAEICEKVKKDKVRQSRLEELAEKKQLEMMQCSPTDGIISNSNVCTESPVAESAPQREGSSMEVSDLDESKASQNPSKSSGSERRDEEAMEEDVPTASSNSRADSRPILKDNTTTPSPSSSQRPGASNAIDDLRNLNLPGVEIFTPDDFSDLTPQEQAMAQRLARRFLPHLQTVNDARDSYAASPSQSQQDNSASQSSFANFKFPEETKGKDLISGQFGSSRDQSSEPCERHRVVYNATESLDPSGNAQDELPEDFFEVTQADVKRMYRDLQKAVEDLDDQPLMTKAMREIKTQAICDIYQQVVIRVHFPDKLVLQAFFRPRETVKSLHAFVRDCLQDKKLKFYLYTTPPRKVLDNMGSTLVSNNLYPAALVYFGCDQVKDSYLDSRLTDEVVSRMEAEEVVYTVRPRAERVDSIANPTTDSQPGPSGSHSRRPGNSSRLPLSSASSSSASGGVPKWLKLGKK